FSPEVYLFSGLGWLYISTDYGRSWSGDSSHRVPGDSYTLSADSCNPQKLYLLNEDFVTSIDNQSEIFITANAGKTWQSVVAHDIPYFTGALASSQHLLFAGTTTDGIVRSADKGMTWESIGGPELEIDSRTIAPMSDNILFALDNQGFLWYTRNSGAHYLDTFPSGAAYALSSSY